LGKNVSSELKRAKKRADIWFSRYVRKKWVIENGDACPFCLKNKIED